jgi:hypothetical protein
MTRDKIIRIALEAGLNLATDVNWMPIIGIEYAEKFAKLVLMNTDPNSFMSYQEGAEAGRLAEREACAKLCDEMEEEAEGTECCKWPTPSDCAYAIRARGNT